MLKQRLAKLREELEEKREKKSGRGSSQSFAVKREGAVQVVLIGLPNSGKSALMGKLTAAKPEVADYPFTTVEPQPGMMQFEDVQIQMVEAPAVVEGSSLGRGLGAKPLSLARSADVIAMVADASSDLVGQVGTILNELVSVGIKVNKRQPAVLIERRSSGGLEIKGGNLVEGGEIRVKQMLLDHGIHNAVVAIDGPLGAEEFVEALEGRVAYKKAFILVSKCDSFGADRRIQELKWEFGGEFKIVLTDRPAERIKREVYENLGLMRVYTKPPDGAPAERPLVLLKNSNVADVAREVHKDFANRLKFARVWGSSKFPGQQVPKDYVLQDKDIIELHV